MVQPQEKPSPQTDRAEALRDEEERSRGTDPMHGIHYNLNRKSEGLWCHRRSRLGGGGW